MKQDDWGPWNGTQQQENKQDMNQQQTPPGYPPTGGSYPPQGGPYPQGYPLPGEGYPPGYRPPGQGMATASLVMGILSIVFWLFHIGYIIFAPLAIIFGAVAKRKGIPSGMATAGIVLGIVSIVLGILIWVACGAFMCAFWDEIMYEVMWELGL